MSLVAPQTNMLTDQIVPALAVSTKTTGTAVAGAVTVTGNAAKITTEALTTVAAASYTLTVTDTSIVATDIVMASVDLGTCTTGEPVIGKVTPGAGTLVIVVTNRAAAAVFNGTLKVSFAVVS